MHNIKTLKKMFLNLKEKSMELAVNPSNVLLQDEITKIIYEIKLILEKNQFDIWDCWDYPDEHKNKNYTSLILLLVALGRAARYSAEHESYKFKAYKASKIIDIFLLKLRDESTGDGSIGRYGLKLTEKEFTKKYDIDPDDISVIYANFREEKIKKQKQEDPVGPATKNSVHAETPTPKMR